jgi:hypothetical protein
MSYQLTYIQAYFQGLSTAARDSIYRDPQRFREIHAAIKEKGVWEEAFEWRMSTETRSRIEVVNKGGDGWYKATSTCDATMTCECPTLERAYEFYSVFAQLHSDLFSAVGWPSWVSAGQMKPDSSIDP